MEVGRVQLSGDQVSIIASSLDFGIGAQAKCRRCRVAIFSSSQANECSAVLGKFDFPNTL